MKRLKIIITIIITSIIILNGCGSSTKESSNNPYFDKNMSKGLVTKQILENKGLYSFQLYNSGRLELSISHIKLNKDKLINSSILYYFNGNKFIKAMLDNDIPKPNNPIITLYTLTDNEWKITTKNFNQTDNNITFNENGYFSKDSNTTILSIEELKGLSIKLKSNNSYPNISNEEFDVKNYILEDSTFSKDTIVVTSKTKYLIESNITIVDKICFPNEGEMECQEDLGTKFYNSNIISPLPSSSSVSITEDDNSISFSSIDEFLLYFKKGGEHFLANNRYSSQFDENNTIYYFDEFNNRVQKTATGKLKKQILNGIVFYEMQIPKEYQNIFQNNSEYYSEGESSTILVDDFNGKLGRGKWQKSNGWSIEKRYNNRAINDIKKAIEKFMTSENSDTIQ